MKHKKKNTIRVRRDYRIAALLILSLALIVGGINLLVAVPAGSISLYAGSFIMVTLGVGGCIASYLKRRETWQPLTSARKMLLGGSAFLISLFGVAMTVLSAGDLKWSGSGLQTACFALMIIAGALSLILILDSQREFTLEGFSFITGEQYAQRWGLTGLRHVYEGNRLGIPLLVSISVGAPDWHGNPRYVVDALCLIDNPLNISLLAYPDRLYGWPPVIPRLPRILRVPHWGRYIVRGGPAGLVAEIIAPFRKHDYTIFSDSYGFERVRVFENKVRGRFVLDIGEKHRITDIIEGLVFFSGHFN
jgi:hypothetical protein